MPLFVQSLKAAKSIAHPVARYVMLKLHQHIDSKADSLAAEFDEKDRKAGLIRWKNIVT